MKDTGFGYLYSWLGDPHASTDTGYSLLGCCAAPAAAAPPPSCHVRHLALLGLWLFSVVAWVVGALAVPTLEIHVLPGTPFKSFYRRSLVQTLVDLAKEHRYFAVTTLGFFSICVPTLKLVCTAWLIRLLFSASADTVYGAHPRKIMALSYFASYQLLDLYVGIMFVVYFNSDSSDARFLSGFYWFFSYCMASMLMSVVLDGAFPGHMRRAAAAGPGTSPASGDLPSLDAHEEGLQGRDFPSSVSSCSDDSQVDTRTAGVASASYVLLLCASIGYPVLEVHTVWSGISVDRSIHPLLDVVFPSIARPFVKYTLLLMNLVIPLVYILSLLLGAQHSAHAGTDLQQFCQLLADFLRPWATTDVLCFATLIFLATVQGERTKTTLMAGSISYYLFLGAGFSLFFLRWLAGGGGGERKARMCRFPLPKLGIMVAVWALVCLVVGGFKSVAQVVQHDIGGGRGGNVGLGAVAGPDFQDLNSICRYVAPLVNETLRKALPAAYGNCSDESSEPPQPCRGSAPLYNHDSGDDFINAKWLGGLNTVRIGSCRLWKDEPVRTGGAPEATTKYHLSIQGSFDEVNLFLHARQCKNIPLGGLLGCTRMNSASHCCGTNIHFNVTFGMDCRPSRGANAFRDILLETFSLDPIIVDTDFLSGALDIQAFDIAPHVERLTKHKLTEIIRTAHLRWAGQPMHIPQLLNRLISYNSPGSAGSC